MPPRPEASGRAAGTPPEFGRFSLAALSAYYRREFGTSLAVNLAYRGAARGLPAFNLVGLFGVLPVAVVLAVVFVRGPTCRIRPW